MEASLERRLAAASGHWAEVPRFPLPYDPCSIAGRRESTCTPGRARDSDLMRYGRSAKQQQRLHLTSLRHRRPLLRLEECCTDQQSQPKVDSECEDLSRASGRCRCLCHRTFRVEGLDPLADGHIVTVSTNRTFRAIKDDFTQDFLFGRPGAYTIADYRLRCNGFRTAARFGTPFAAAPAFECWPIMAFQRSQRAL